jgi:hypothetical protein
MARRASFGIGFGSRLLAVVRASRRSSEALPDRIVTEPERDREVCRVEHPIDAINKSVPPGPVMVSAESLPGSAEGGNLRLMKWCFWLAKAKRGLAERDGCRGDV